MALFDVVIPARNEEGTVGDVARAAGAARGVGRVLVVDDGSTDGTAAAARAAGAEVVAARPAGAPGGDKALALAAGVRASAAPVLVFFDADILRPCPGHFEALAAPVLSGEVALSCGLLDYGPLRTRFYLHLPPITGLRALRREIFEGVPEARRRGFRIEILVNEVAVRRGEPTAIRVLHGLGHRSKLQKLGWRRGLPAHLRMSAELLGCLRTVPLWTYLHYLRRLRILPPVLEARTGADAGVAPHPVSPRDTYEES